LDRQRYDVWGVGESVGGFVSPAPGAKGLESIDRFQFGMVFGDGLEVGAEIHARSLADAEKLRATLEMISAMLKAQQPSGSAARFDLQGEEGTIKLTAAIPEEELKRVMEKSVAHAMARTAVAVNPAAAPMVAPTPEPTASQVLDKEGNTVILHLPGGK
jgi:hypothetical protein